MNTRRDWRKNERIDDFFKLLKHSCFEIEEEENREFGAMKETNYQHEISELTRRMNSGPLEDEERRRLKKKLLHYTSLRDKKSALVTKEREKERGKFHEEEEEEDEDENPTVSDFLDLSDNYIIMLWHDEYQHKNEIVMLPKIQMIVPRKI